MGYGMGWTELQTQRNERAKRKQIEAQRNPRTERPNTRLKAVQWPGKQRMARPPVRPHFVDARHSSRETKTPMTMWWPKICVRRVEGHTGHSKEQTPPSHNENANPSRKRSARRANSLSSPQIDASDASFHFLSSCCSGGCTDRYPCSSCRPNAPSPSACA